MGALHSQNINTDPSRVTWKWEYVPNLFTPYPPQVSAFIERHFVADFTGQFQVQIPGSGLHTIDLTKMTHTGFQLERRILRDISQEPSINVLWSWENDLGEMESYTQEDSDKIEAFYQRKDINFTHIWIGGFEYWIDLRNQCQISIRSMRKRRIERNIIPDHKYVWQWQADNGEFVNYIDSISKKIELDYFLKHDSPLAIPISGTMYFIDTQRMCEINETDGKERQIRRVLENYIRYKWLWKDELDTWHSYSPCLSERFETNYLNPNSGPFVIYINYNEFQIDTRTMMETNTLSGKGYQIKRQALHNDFPVWGWITKNGAFKAFSPSDSKLMEANFILNDPSPLNVKVQDTEYSINVKSRTRIHKANQKQKTIERRLITNNYPPNLDFLPKGECFKIFKFLAQNGYLPPDWDANQKEEVQKFQASDIEWNIFSEKFYKTMSSDEWLLSNLYRFQSVSLINSFMLNKMTLKVCNRSFEEPELLFYVPNKEAGPDMLDSLCENPLTGQFSPLNSFGKGYYFTKTVKGCKDYAWEREDGTKVIMCFWVLPGKTLKVKQEDDVNALYGGKYKEWNEVKKAPMGADCSRVVMDGEEMLVVYNAERCYPMYILEFNNIN